jgi:hypothetical protein
VGRFGIDLAAGLGKLKVWCNEACLAFQRSNLYNSLVWKSVSLDGGREYRLDVCLLHMPISCSDFAW